MAGREPTKTLDVSALRDVQRCLYSVAFGDWPQQLLTHRLFHSDARAAVVCPAVYAVSWAAFEYAVEGSSVSSSI